MMNAQINATAITHSQLLSPESAINPTFYKTREVTEAELVRLGSVTGAGLLTRGLNQEGARNQRISERDFPGGTVVESPPANAGDTGSSPGPGRPHMLQSNWAHAPQLLSLQPQLLSPRATTTEAVCLEPVLRNKRSHRNEKPAHHNEE
ncbi:hypothetical protein J1605_003524 [Eschrichtius robustus]|uniref:Uncharacterized protein n=1 Tax=Eschrichtius robustus TaxID=9764 RepID=A0AB34HNC6_ESCRO|nr:hypothetical protein J1605_003524 [Eschrichtius robustus]